jgi:hypothetical protein
MSSKGDRQVYAEKAAEYGVEIAPNDWAAELWKVSLEFVAEFWPCIEIVAAELEREVRLPGSRVEALVEQYASRDASWRWFSRALEEHKPTPEQEEEYMDLLKENAPRRSGI